jgi:hypothetical protein
VLINKGVKKFAIRGFLQFGAVGFARNLGVEGVRGGFFRTFLNKSVTKFRFWRLYLLAAVRGSRR